MWKDTKQWDSTVFLCGVQAYQQGYGPPPQLVWQGMPMAAFQGMPPGYQQADPRAMSRQQQVCMQTNKPCTSQPCAYIRSCHRGNVALPCLTAACVAVNECMGRFNELCFEAQQTQAFTEVSLMWLLQQAQQYYMMTSGQDGTYFDMASNSFMHSGRGYRSHMGRGAPTPRGGGRRGRQLFPEPPASNHLGACPAAPLNLFLCQHACHQPWHWASAHCTCRWFVGSCGQSLVCTRAGFVLSCTADVVS